ncbi:hypothetical protein PR048_024223 [Dryococelus australis]|uniref:Uncharacterized protein n=1 Tax=Dryococelus australis TaxID=614101 RepID=A0ABQ9GN10_9NEOP|nr:hypothetical protein PR048_024223 [Dryococelus australis]
MKGFSGVPEVLGFLLGENSGISGISPGPGRADQGLDSGWQWLNTLMLGETFWRKAFTKVRILSREGAQVWFARKRTHLLKNTNKHTGGLPRDQHHLLVANVILSYLQYKGSRGEVVRLLTSHQGEPGSIPDRVTPGFSHVGIVADDAASRRVFSGICGFPHPCVPALLHIHIISPSSAE